MTLFRYILLRFILTFLRIFFIFAALLFLVGIVDELGSLTVGEGIGRAIYLAVIGQAETLYTILPLVTIISAITFFLGLSRSSELVAVRAAGISGLRFLIAPSLGAGLIGLLAIGVFNPIVTVLTTKYLAEKGRINASTTLSLGKSGLWLRQGDGGQQTMIHAQTTQNAGLMLVDVTFINFDAAGAPVNRIEAASATLTSDAWVLSGALSWDLTTLNPQAGRSILPDGTRVATQLQPQDLTAGFGKPNSVSIWALSAHIRALENAGFSARAFRVWLQSELAKPLSLVVMVLVAAGFTMRHIRAGNSVQMVIFAVLLGFGIFFLRNIAEVFSQNGQIPVILAAWGPSIAVLFLALSFLLHLEEG